MPSHNIFKFKQVDTPLIENRIGTAFPSVKHVEQNLEYLKHVSTNLPAIYDVYENIESLLGAEIYIRDFEERYPNGFELNFIIDGGNF